MLAMPQTWQHVRGGNGGGYYLLVVSDDAYTMPIVWSRGRGGQFQCPEEGCLGGASNGTNLQVKFLHRHLQDTIVIL